MGVNNETLYLKIEQNTIVYDRHVVLNDIAKMECTNEAVLRQLKQKKIYSFTNQKDEKKEKNQMQVFSVLKIIEQIHEDYPSLTISNEGESDFIIEYIPNPEKPKVMNTIKTVLLCIIIFFGSAFTIMAFNNDISVTDVFDKLKCATASDLDLASFYFSIMSEERRSRPIQRRSRSRCGNTKKMWIPHLLKMQAEEVTA